MSLCYIFIIFLYRLETTKARTSYLPGSSLCSEWQKKKIITNLQYFNRGDWYLGVKQKIWHLIDSSKGLFQIWWCERGHKKWRISNMGETDVQQDHHILHIFSL